jgi:hypothetical protein
MTSRSDEEQPAGHAIREELKKILTLAPEPARGLRALLELQLIQKSFPELARYLGSERSIEEWLNRINRGAQITQGMKLPEQLTLVVMFALFLEPFNRLLIKPKDRLRANKDSYTASQSLDSLGREHISDYSELHPNFLAKANSLNLAGSRTPKLDISSPANNQLKPAEELLSRISLKPTEPIYQNIPVQQELINKINLTLEPLSMSEYFRCGIIQAVLFSSNCINNWSPRSTGKIRPRARSGFKIRTGRQSDLSTYRGSTKVGQAEANPVKLAGKNLPAESLTDQVVRLLKECPFVNWRSLACLVATHCKVSLEEVRPTFVAAYALLKSEEQFSPLALLSEAEIAEELVKTAQLPQQLRGSAELKSLVSKFSREIVANRYQIVTRCRARSLLQSWIENRSPEG